MNNMNPLSRMRLASRLCIVGAWTSLLLGFVLIILFYVLNNVDNGPNSGPGPGLGVTLFVAVLIAMLSMFFFLVLYAIGAVLNYMSVSKNTLEEGAIPPGMSNLPEEDDVQLEIISIQKMR